MISPSSQDQCLSLAYQVLCDWEKEANLDLLIDRLRSAGTDSTLINRSFTLLRLMFRKKASLDFIIKKLCPKKPKERLNRVLLLSLTQKLYQDGLADALVTDCAVRFAKDRFQQSEANFINACLRKADISILEGIKLPLEAELNLSPALVQSWKKQYKVKTIRKVSKILEQPAPLLARILSGHKPNLDGLTPVDLPPWAENYTFYKIEEPKKFFAENRHKDFYIQDPATVSSINLLNPQEGEVIADLCAAPGGKSLLTIERIGEKGFLYSSDFSAKRLELVKENLRHFSNTKIFQQDATAPELETESLDAVILDVPCSNSGVIRRKADVRWTYSEKKTKELNEIQTKMLTTATTLIKKGGRILYSTCSIEKCENSELIAEFLKKMTNFRLVAERQILPSDYFDGSYSALLERND